MRTAQQAAAHLTRYACDSLIRNLEATPPDKQTWKPLDAGASALEQVQQTAVMCAWGAGVLRDHKVPQEPPIGTDAYQTAVAGLDTAGKTVAALRKNAETLIGAITAFPDDLLDKSVSMPFDPDMTMTYEELLFMGGWNMIYHYGQIAYIQTLYGDTEMH